VEDAPAIYRGVGHVSVALASNKVAPPVEKVARR
jgi:hypothetical protein